MAGLPFQSRIGRRRTGGRMDNGWGTLAPSTVPYATMLLCPRTLLVSCACGPCPNNPPLYGHGYLWLHALMAACWYALARKWAHARMASCSDCPVPPKALGPVPSWPNALMRPCPTWRHAVMALCPCGPVRLRPQTFIAACPYGSMAS